MSAAFEFIKRSAGATVRGSGAYYKWLGFLLLWITLGLVAYVHQLRSGLTVTHMSDQVLWGIYIGNFTYLVGTAAAAVMIVIPAQLYRDRPLSGAVVLGELMAVAALVMCLLFLFVDLGRPDRFWHMLPLVGRFNWPASLMAWDVLVLSGYLLLNIYLAVKSLYANFCGRQPRGRLYRPMIYVAVVWAIAIHTVTAFIFSGLGARPYWNVAVMAPHFLASAFTAGPALMILILCAVRHHLGFDIQDAALERLRQISVVAMLINLFLFASEIFTSLYSGTHHGSAMTYHLLGLPGHRSLAVGTWIGLVLSVTSAVILLWRRLHSRPRLLLTGCAAAVLGVWFEKGLGVVVPGLVPTPLGEVTNYFPSFTEICITLGIWAFGALLYTLLLKAAVPIAAGRLRNE